MLSYAHAAARYRFKTACTFFILILAGFLHASRLEAVQLSGSTYNTSLPDVANWSSGWGSAHVTGWDYLGQVNGATGVYLGNNWVLTANHVGTGDFVMDGTNYSFVAGSSRSIITGTDLADLLLFQIASAPSLPPLILAGNSQQLSGQTVIMTGFGVKASDGPQVKTWGANTISNDTISVEVQVQNTTYNTIDFETDYGGGNQAMLILGDSGGGDFIYADNQWLLAGINETVDHNNSYMVQIGVYADAVNSITDIPEPGVTALFGPGLILIVLCRRKRSSGFTF